MIVTDLQRVAGQVASLVRGFRIDLSNEKAAQAELHLGFEAAGLDVEREVRLAPGDIIDMMLPCGLGIEVKLRGAQKRRVFGQMVRYASHERVAGLLLISNMAMGLPPSINGKPAWYVSLGYGWL